MARVYEGEARVAQRILGPVERLIYRLLGIDPSREMGWREYALADAGDQRPQHRGRLPDPAAPGRAARSIPPACPACPPALALNTAISFATNTNWQAYGGESSLSYFTQMLALTVQNFVSAAVGMAVLAAFIRGLHRRSSATIGNAWVDTTRSVLYILLPMSLVLSLAPGVAGRGADVGALQGSDAGPAAAARFVDRDHPDHSPRAGGVPDRDQAAGDQRRRLLQRQFGAPLREPDAVLQPARGGVDPPDSRRRSASPSAGWSRTNARAGRCWRR